LLARRGAISGARLPIDERTSVTILTLEERIRELLGLAAILFT